MTEQKEFITRLKSLLDEVGIITKDEEKQAILMIQDCLRQSKRMLLRSRGSCLNCRSVEIEYGYPCKTHLAKGDVWFDGLFENWISPPRVEVETNSWRKEATIRINGFALSTVSPYICSECLDEIAELIDKTTTLQYEVDTTAARRQQNSEIAVIRGEKKATAAKRYWTFLRCFQRTQTEELRDLSYRDFLNTIYWDIVRNYVVYKRGYRCELCGNNQNLDVHHKSYENHGEEHAHLDDLIVLCRNCHSKFHDKFDEPEY